MKPDKIISGKSDYLKKLKELLYSEWRQESYWKKNRNKLWVSSICDESRTEILLANEMATL